MAEIKYPVRVGGCKMDNQLTTEDEVWLSHMEDREGQWLALAGEYPHTLAGVGYDPIEAVEDAKQNGCDEPVLFYVPPPYPICTTPFLAPWI